MTSLFTESFCNKIKMEGNLSLSSNLKKTVQTYLSSKITNYIKTKVIDYNYIFQELKTDLLCSILNSDYNMTLLENRGYKITTEESYTTEFYNAVESYKTISAIKKTNIKEQIDFTCEDREKKLSYFTSDNIVCLYDENETKTEYYFKLVEYNILDFKVDNNDFIYMIIEKSNKKYLVVSHLTLDFVTLNSMEGELKEESLISFIAIDGEGILEQLNLNKIVISNEKGLIEINLCKKYYFSKENKLFFNYTEDLENFKEKFIDKFIQVNHLNLYNYLNFLGLNEFKVDGKRKISSFEIELFENIFKNKFDNTLNGGLNFFNSKIYDVSGNKKVIDYKTVIEDEYFSINGNFNNNFETGEFSIEIENYKCKLFKILESSKLFIKEITIPTNVYSFYFCNLKFNFKKFELPLSKLTYKFKVSYPYTFKIEKKENFELDKLYNNKKANDRKMKKITTKTTGLMNDTWFNGKSIVFKNSFDFKNKKFLYGSLVINGKRNDVIDISKYKNFFTTGNHILKENFIILKEDSTVYLTTLDYIKFDIITENNYISDFWFDNQGKTLFFKNTDNNIKIVSDINKADYVVKIPFIKNYINKLEPTSEILDSSEDIVKIKNNDNIIITDKYFNKPLYNKSFLYNVEDINTLQLFDSDGVEIFEYITDVKNNILEIYFNADDNKNYYCKYDDKNYIYLTIEKAQDDFKIQIGLDENGEKKLERTVINKFSLNYDRVLKSNEYINLFIYDLQNKTSVKVNFDNNDLDKEFELNVKCDYIIAEANFDIDFTKLNINIVNLKSFIEGEYIYFIKNYYADLLYITTKKEQFNEKYLRKKLKVSCKYDVSNGTLIESENGTFLIEKPQSYSIYIENLNTTNLSIDDTILFSINEDSFYNKNFKTPGLIILHNDINKDTRIEKTSSNLLIGGENELF